MFRFILMLTLGAAVGCVEDARQASGSDAGSTNAGSGAHDAAAGHGDAGATPQRDDAGTTVQDAGPGGSTVPPDDDDGETSNGSAGQHAGTGGTGGTGGAGAGAAGSGSAGNAAGSDADSGVDPSAELYDAEQLPRFDIELSSDAQAALGSAPTTYVRGTVRYGATTLTNVGVRIKGEASQRNLEQKAAFKLKFDEFVSNQRLLGLTRVTLNNMVQDPSFISERLAYSVFLDAGLPAPRCNNALVYVNGDFYGVYTNIEAQDKTFLRRWFKSDAGNLYEDAEVDLQPGNATVFQLQTNETKNDRTDLTALIDAVTSAEGDSYLATLDATLDTDQYLHFAALEGIVNQWDGYSYTVLQPNNFRMYNDPTTHKFKFLPWGMDQALKPYAYSTRVHIPMFTAPRYNDDQDVSVQRDAGGLLLTKCLASSTCKASYAKIVGELITRYEALNVEALAAHHYAQIKDYVPLETRAETTPAEFEAAYQKLLTVVRGRAAAVRADITAAGY